MLTPIKTRKYSAVENFLVYITNTNPKTSERQKVTLDLSNFTCNSCMHRK
jgi:hypothetical protein